jgi:4-hydroxy-3-methylbut-2-enyl diphosphate reductase
MGQLPDGAVTLIETEQDADSFVPPSGQALGFVTQTTLSVEDTAGVIPRWRSAFPTYRRLPPNRSATPPPTGRMR